ncbi:MAG: transglutaminase domain-containing protein [Candidatus Omnitrophica bacterium]|nr:transglutaminase domain-containing protein [Candidatus Omnitrophota bacterium]
MKRNVKRIILALILLSAVILAVNIPTHIQVGVSGQYRIIRMPFYAKWTQFLARHYEYGRLSREITAGCRTDEEKVLAIFKWVRAHLKDVPAGMPVCDDHVLYIIIRGYATPGQFQDVFTTLCAYAGIPAFFDRVYDESHENRYILSFVRLSGKLRVFDAYRGIYFRTGSREIAATDDIVRDRSIVDSKDTGTVLVNGAPYKEFFHDLSGVSEPQTIRPRKQMPLPRIVFEIKQAVGIEREERDAGGAD